MCLQDVQIQRAVLLTQDNYSFGVATAVDVLQKDESRIGYMITGPSSGTADVRIGGTTIGFNVVRMAATMPENSRLFTLFDYGPIVTLPVRIVTSGASDFAVFSWTLPMDRDQLQRLANQGKF